MNSVSVPGTLILPDARLYVDDTFANVAYVGDRMLVIDAACSGALLWSSQMDFSLQHIAVVTP